MEGVLKEACMLAKLLKHKLGTEIFKLLQRLLGLGESPFLYHMIIPSLAQEPEEARETDAQKQWHCNKDTAFI